MESDDCQHSSGYQRCQGDQYRLQMGDKNRETLTGGLRQVGLTPPFVKDNATARDQHYQRHPHEKSPKTNVQSRRIPIDDLLGSVSRFILKRLYVANKNAAINAWQIGPLWGKSRRPEHRVPSSAVYVDFLAAIQNINTKVSTNGRGRHRNILIQTESYDSTVK
jgi:hypothetical protein